MEVIVLGASNNPDRTSNMAMTRLAAKGHKPIPVHPKEKSVAGSPCFPNLTEAAKAFPDFHTLTVYVNDQLSGQMESEILKVKPKRVIFNPGSENATLFKKLQSKGIEVENACTLVLLASGQF